MVKASLTEGQTKWQKKNQQSTILKLTWRKKLPALPQQQQTSSTNQNQLTLHDSLTANQELDDQHIVASDSDMNESAHNPDKSHVNSDASNQQAENVKSTPRTENDTPPLLSKPAFKEFKLSDLEALDPIFEDQDVKSTNYDQMLTDAAVFHGLQSQFDGNNSIAIIDPLITRLFLAWNEQSQLKKQDVLKTFKNQHKKIRSKTIILIPIVLNLHWTMLISTSSMSLHFDSCATGSQSTHGKVASRIVSALNLAKLKSIDTPKQRNNIDCGVYATLVAEHATRQLLKQNGFINNRIEFEHDQQIIQNRRDEMKRVLV